MYNKVHCLDFLCKCAYNYSVNHCKSCTTVKKLIIDAMGIFEALPAHLSADNSVLVYQTVKVI